MCAHLLTSWNYKQKLLCVTVCQSMICFTLWGSIKTWSTGDMSRLWPNLRDICHLVENWGKTGRNLFMFFFSNFSIYFLYFSFRGNSCLELIWGTLLTKSNLSQVIIFHKHEHIHANSSAVSPPTICRTADEQMSCNASGFECHAELNKLGALLQNTQFEMFTSLILGFCTETVFRSCYIFRFRTICNHGRWWTDKCITYIYRGYLNCNLHKRIAVNDRFSLSRRHSAIILDNRHLQ